MTQMFYKLLILVCFFGPAADAQIRDRWCMVDDIPLATPSAPVRFNQLDFESSATYSEARVNVFNPDRRRIAHYLILIEMFDRDGKYLLTVPLFDIVRKTLESPFAVTFTRWLYGHQNSTETLGPQSEATLDGTTPQVMFVCPTSARVSQVDLMYSTGDAFHYSSPDLNLDPIIAWAPLSDRKLSRWAPFFATGTIVIDSDGHGRLADFTHASTELLQLMQQQLDRWLFSKPLLNGKLAQAELTLMLCLEDVREGGGPQPLPDEYLDQMPLLKARGVFAPIVIVHAYRTHDQAKNWVVTAGYNYVDRMDKSQR